MYARTLNTLFSLQPHLWDSRPQILVGCVDSLEKWFKLSIRLLTA